MFQSKLISLLYHKIRLYIFAEFCINKGIQCKGLYYKTHNITSGNISITSQDTSLNLKHSYGGISYVSHYLPNKISKVYEICQVNQYSVQVNIHTENRGTDVTWTTQSINKYLLPNL